MSAWGAADDQGDKYEAERFAIAQLLEARGHVEAAAIVAVSAYHSDVVSDLDDYRYAAVIEVPPQLYDVANSEFADAISSAAEAVIGADSYWCLRLRVLTAQPNADWVETIVRRLGPHRVQSERVAVTTPSIDTVLS